MRNARRLRIGFLAACLAGCAAPADFEARAPDGRTLLLRNDGTWRYAPEGYAAASAAVEESQALLRLTDKTEDGPSCRLALQMTNRLPYEIHSVVPTFVAYRSNGAIHRQVSVNFNDVFPGDTQTRVARFEGIACGEIARVQVTGGQRCTMGDLDKFNSAGGECLARIKLLPSSVMPFGK